MVQGAQQVKEAGGVRRLHRCWPAVAGNRLLAPGGQGSTLHCSINRSPRNKGRNRPYYLVDHCLITTIFAPPLSQTAAAPRPVGGRLHLLAEEVEKEENLLPSALQFYRRIRGPRSLPLPLRFAALPGMPFPGVANVACVRAVLVKLRDQHTLAGFDVSRSISA